MGTQVASPTPGSTHLTSSASTAGGVPAHTSDTAKQGPVGPSADDNVAHGETIDEIKSSLEWDVRILQKVVAQLNMREGLVTRDDINQLKILEKAAVPSKNYTSSQLREIRREVNLLKASLLERLPEEERALVQARAREELAPYKNRRPRVAPKHERPPTPLLAAGKLPQAPDFFEDLKAGKISWEEALNPQPGKKTITLDQVEIGTALGQEYLQRQTLKNLRLNNPELSTRKLAEMAFGHTPSRQELRKYQRWLASDRPIDGRRERMTKRRVLVPLVVALILKHYNGRRAADEPGIADSVNGELATFGAEARADGYTGPIPKVTDDSVYKFIASLPEGIKIVRNDGFDAWAKQHRMVNKRQEALYANHIWQIDHTEPDIANVASSDDPDNVVQMWVTVCKDVYTGIPMAAHSSSQAPDAYATSLVLGDAIRGEWVGDVRLGGIPKILRVDRGTDFKSTHVQQIAAALNIQLEYCDPRAPDQKPHVENFMKVLNQWLARYVGHKNAEGRSKGAAQKRTDRLLTAKQVIEAVKECRMHCILGHRKGQKQSRLVLFDATVKMDYPPDPAQLDLLLLKADRTRKISRGAIQFDGVVYNGVSDPNAGHAIQDFEGRTVVVRYHPDLRDSIYAYDAKTGKRIGEFIREELWRATIGAQAANEEYVETLHKVTTKFALMLKKEDRAQAKIARKAETERKIAELRARGEAAGTLALTQKQDRAKKRSENDDERLMEMYEDLVDD